MYSRILVSVDLENADKLGKARNLAGQTAKQCNAEVVCVDDVDAVPTTFAGTHKRAADCDLIVMACHMLGFKDHVLSSNAGDVASQPPMNVYVVR